MFTIASKVLAFLALASYSGCYVTCCEVGMNIFISWSGERSRFLANALKSLLRRTLQATRPFMSDSDIAAGVEWFGEVRTRLAASTFGIVCVTNENYQSPWLHFEAGALSNHLGGGSRVVPYLLDFEPAKLSTPLSMFQAKCFKRDDTLALLRSVNAATAEPLIHSRELDEQFDKWWLDFENDVMAIKATNAQPPKGPTQEELMTSISAQLSMLVQRIGGQQSPINVGLGPWNWTVSVTHNGEFKALTARRFAGHLAKMSGSQGHRLRTAINRFDVDLTCAELPPAKQIAELVDRFGKSTAVMIEGPLLD
jgi:hypothetical protein